MILFIDFKDVSELALHVHAESKMIIFMSGLFVFLSDDNGARPACFSNQASFFVFFFLRGCGAIHVRNLGQISFFFSSW